MNHEESYRHECEHYLHGHEGNAVSDYMNWVNVNMTMVQGLFVCRWRCGRGEGKAVKVQVRMVMVINESSNQAIGYCKQLVDKVCGEELGSRRSGKE